jgi:hypothetical protein
MTTISAKSILASRHATTGKRIDTMLLRYPRFIHAEFMTHRMFSRNAASSRAIPVAKLIKDILEEPAAPLHWGKNQKGMQATEECNGPILDWSFGEDRLDRVNAWMQALIQAVAAARAFDAAGYHKQIVNRLLEPFSHITVVVTATEWANFFALRDHADAEPHIAMLAREMRKAMQEAEVQTLHPGEWHLPFVTPDDWVEINGGGGVTQDQHEARLKLSVARCASTSYKTVDGFDMTLERAIDLHDKLLAATPLHASPAEHQAQADELVTDSRGDMQPEWEHPEQWGNFKHFRQYRKMLLNEAVW